MKRSKVNEIIRYVQEKLDNAGVALPGFSRFKPEDFKAIDMSVFKAVMLGWDITDFGSGDFDKIGAVLFTIRNGELNGENSTPYAEKMIYVKNGQRLPCHFHFTKTEDIINRGGGPLWMKLYNALPDRSVDTKSPVTVYADGVKMRFEPGEPVKITRGNSLTLTPYIYHTFGASEGDAIAWEVSSVNDDNADNCFCEETKRFAGIEEDEPPAYLLCNEYVKWLG